MDERDGKKRNLLTYHKVVCSVEQLDFVSLFVQSDYKVLDPQEMSFNAPLISIAHNVVIWGERTLSAFMIRHQNY